MNIPHDPELDKITEVFGKVLSERKRQLQKLANGEIPIDLYSKDVNPQDKFLHLAEELCEVAKAIRNRYQVYGLLDSQKIALRENLETELVQLATHSVTWRASLI